MDAKGQALLKLLFNEGESVCVSSNEFACQSIPLEKALDGDLTLKSNNEENPDILCHSSDLILVSMNPIVGKRNDDNVTAFRSFLVELDAGTIPEQLGTISHLKMPFSAQVFSGGKSVHTIITLSEDLKNYKQWRFMAEWILNVVSMADQLCKNPSRMVRIPGGYRDGGKKQRLIGSIGNRITIKELTDWLSKYNTLQPKVREKKEFIEGQEADFDRLSPWCHGMLKKGAEFRLGRNQTWYAMAVDFAKAGFSEDRTVEVLGTIFSEDYDFKEKEWLTCIGSAFKSVLEGK